MQLNQVQRFPNSMNYPSKYRNRIAPDGTPKSMNYNYCPCAGLADNKQSDNILEQAAVPVEDNRNTASGHSKATCPCQSGEAFAPESEYLSLATSRDDDRLQRVSRTHSSNSHRKNMGEGTDLNLQLQEASRRGDKQAMDDTRNYVVRHLLVQAITLMDGCECSSSNGPSQRGDELDEPKCALQITNASRLEVVEGKLSTTCPQATITIPVSSFPCAILFKPNADNTDFNVTHVPLSNAPGAKVFGAPYGATTIYGDLDGPVTSRSETKSAGVASLKEITDVNGGEAPSGRSCADKCLNTETLGGLDASGLQCICVEEKPSVSSTKRTDDLAKALETDPSQSSTKGVPGTSEIACPISITSECDCDPSIASTKGVPATSEIACPISKISECDCVPSIASTKGVPGTSEIACPISKTSECDCVPSLSSTKDLSALAKAQSGVEEPIQGSEHSMPPTKALEPGSVCPMASQGVCENKPECNLLQCECSDTFSAPFSVAKDGTKTKQQEGEDDTQTSEHSLASKRDASIADDKITTSDGADIVETKPQEGKDDTQTSEHSLASKRDASDADDKITTSDGADIVESVIKDTVASERSLSSKKEPSIAEEVEATVSSVSSKKEPSTGMGAAECSDADCECEGKPSADKQPSEIAKSLASAASICSNAECDCVNKPSDFSQKHLQSDSKPLEVSNKPSEVSAVHPKDATALDDILCSNTACECINRPSAFSRSAASAGFKKTLDDVSAASTKGPNSVLECKCDFGKFKCDSRAMLAQYECDLDDAECEAAREELYKKLNATKPSTSLADGRQKSPSPCNCCYCQTRRKDQNANAEISEMPMPTPRRPEEEVYDDGASAAPGLQADYKEMKFFIDSLVFDYEVMQAVRQKSKERSCGCSSKSLVRDEDIPEGGGYPASITNVRRVGCKALFVNWVVRNGIEIGGFELYLDDVLYNRYRSNDHRAGLIYNVDIKAKHIVMLKTLPIGFDDCGCGYGGGNADPSNKNWSPSVFVYEPGSRNTTNTTKQLEPLATAVEETNQ